MGEINWWKVRIEENRPINVSIWTPQIIPSTDASQDSWVQHLNQRTRKKKFGSRGTNARNGEILEAINEKQRPISAVQPVQSLSQRVSTAAASLRQLTDRVLKKIEDLKIQIRSVRIKWKSNIIADSISRLAIS
ncbi:MAG: hypothetical protein EZS28_015437 [Streblomastix strix]|uniref:Uncharacterized protein n=1 Tax=Streblomastix strix TaxID=222440 RepID=A0A5J4W290_9EUKA|nr:MAG: hypothetical protein EZS28_015437 [Streblomastix strix]